ncbi:hypothetical protein [Chelativorans alearense]|uniref:hypothetical protein n=1 Tax=Chelativorans alearense TaxID=2681495 RepID=UPI0013D0F72B|nr:hypothetical protein [Chelativorans alearense]
MTTYDVDAILSASREFAALLEQVANGPVELTRDGGRAYMLMRADHFCWMKMAVQRRHCGC